MCFLFYLVRTPTSSNSALSRWKWPWEHGLLASWTVEGLPATTALHHRRTGSCTYWGQSTGLSPSGLWFHRTNYSWQHTLFSDIQQNHWKWCWTNIGQTLISPLELTVNAAMAQRNPRMPLCCEHILSRLCCISWLRESGKSCRVSFNWTE